jgi:hypothetical protein
MTFTLRTVKQRLIATFPETEFSYGTGGRGRRRGHMVTWTGGPATVDVQIATDPYNRVVKHFGRQPTPEEWAAQLAQWDIDDAARLAAEPARKAQAKADGLARRQATLARRKAHTAILAANWPGVVFTLTHTRNHFCISWTDGPDRNSVAAACGVVNWTCTRTVSPREVAAAKAHDAATVVQNRLARRLAQSKVRAIRVRKGIQRRERLENPGQLWLPFAREASANVFELT